MIDEALAHKLNTKWCYKHCAIQQPQDAKWINKCIAMASIQYYHERDRMNQWNSIADNKYFFEGSIRFDCKALLFILCPFLTCNAINDILCLAAKFN